MVAVPVAPKSVAGLIKAMVADFVGVEIDDYPFPWGRGFLVIADLELLK